MIFSILKFRSYNWLSEKLNNENWIIKETIKYIQSSQHKSDEVRMVNLNNLINKRRIRNELMDEIYRRADMIDYAKVVADFRIPCFTAGLS